MAEMEEDQEDKTEEATPERRDEFREQGQIAHSQELSQVGALAASVGFFSWYSLDMLGTMKSLLLRTFQSLPTLRVDEHNIIPIISSTWVLILQLILPIFAVVAVIGSIITLLQTQFNWSWQKLEFDFQKLNPFPGLMRMFQLETFVGLMRSFAKLTVVSLISWLILKGEWHKVPALLNVPYVQTWTYLSNITSELMWGVVGLMLFVATGDFIYSFISLERKMRMTKNEVKEETKQRETDPQVKAKLRKMARDIANNKSMENTKKATVLITNPTHYSIAVQYELGMAAPIVVAKGVDFLALRMRETAKELGIPIVENKPLARAIFASVKEGEEIPTSMYKAVSEIIKFVFQLKGVKIGRSTSTKNESSTSP